MKQFVLSLLVGGALVSCSRDQEEVISNIITNQPENTPILLTALKSTDSNGDILNSTFTYDGNKIKEIVIKGGKISDTKVSFIYTGNQITSIINGNDEGNTNTTFIYNPNGTLKNSVTVRKETSANNSYTTTATKNYTYLNNGDVNVTKSITSTNPNNIPTNESYVITTVNGNLYKIAYKSTLTDANGTREYTTTTSMQYDNKNSPLKNVIGISAIMFERYEFDSKLGFTNNISHEEEQHTNKYIPLSGTAIVSSQTNITTSTFEYNANDYPTKQIVKETSSLAGSTPYTETITYTYNK